jgi:hypothetical protein
LTSLLLADKEENQRGDHTHAEDDTDGHTSLRATSEGMTGGAKAGVAIGVIFGVGVIAALIFFFIRKNPLAGLHHQRSSHFPADIPLDFSSSCG